MLFAEEGDVSVRPCEQSLEHEENACDIAYIWKVATGKIQLVIMLLQELYTYQKQRSG